MSCPRVELGYQRNAAEKAVDGRDLMKAAIFGRADPAAQLAQAG